MPTSLMIAKRVMHANTRPRRALCAARHNDWLHDCVSIQYTARMIGRAIKGRGAVSRTPNRYAKRALEVDDSPEAPVGAPETTLRPMTARSIISSNTSPDIPFDRSINPYLGCEHGCVYCYARPAHSNLDLSPGLDFETQIFYKPNAAERLLRSWENPRYVVKPITIGANTDPYQPAERRLEITRSLLELFLRHEHPVSIISKGVLMQRDLDLLSELAARKLVSVTISMPTMDMQLKRLLEPRVPSAKARFKLIEGLHSAGVACGLLVAPIIPAVNDKEIEMILERAANAGVQQAAYIFLRLPHELKAIFTEWLETHMPERRAHVMSLIRQASGGKDYDNRFGIRQTGRGPYADMIRQRFAAACRRYGIAYGEGARHSGRDLDCTRFRAPGAQQMSLGFCR